MKSPIFQIIKDFLIKQKEFSGVFELKTTKAQGNEPVKQYYMQPLEKASAVLIILNKKWQCREHHISIYEEQLLSKNVILAHIIILPSCKINMNILQLVFTLIIMVNISIHWLKTIKIKELI